MGLVGLVWSRAPRQRRERIPWLVAGWFWLVRFWYMLTAAVFDAEDGQNVLFSLVQGWFYWFFAFLVPKTGSGGFLALSLKHVL